MGISDKRQFWQMQSRRYQNRGGNGLSEIIAREELTAASKLWNAKFARLNGWILDLGAGGGGFWNLCTPPQKLIAIDLIPSIAPSTTYSFRISGDASFLPVETHSISAILALGLLEYIPDLEALFLDWRRVCKEDALLLVSNSPPILPNRLRRWMGLGAIPRSDEEIIGTLIKCGWCVLDGSGSRAGWQSFIMAKTELQTEDS